jgi:hypothetical protein
LHPAKQTIFTNVASDHRYYGSNNQHQVDEIVAFLLDRINKSGLLLYLFVVNTEPTT